MGSPKQLLRISVRGLGDTALRPGDELRLGRHPSNDIVIDEQQVSRRHARLFWEKLDARARVEDLGSSNGVHVNEMRISKPHTLADEDEVRIGSIVLTVRYQVDRGPTQRVRRSTLAAKLTGEPTRKGWLSPRLTLQTLLENLGDEQKTGALQLGTEEESKVVLLKKGRVINAETAGVSKPTQALRVILETTKPGAMYRFFLKHDVTGDLDLAPKTLFHDASATARFDRIEG